MRNVRNRQAVKRLAAKSFRANRTRNTIAVIAIALKGPGVIVRVRELLGPTNSQKAQKGTIRGDFGTDSMMNICHASDSRESAAVELARFFREEELFDGLN